MRNVYGNKYVNGTTINTFLSNEKKIACFFLFNDLNTVCPIYCRSININAAKYSFNAPTAGVPQQMLHEISFKALPAALVEKVEVDVGDLKVGDTIRVCDLPIAQDKDVDLMTDAEATVVTITEVHVSAADAAEEADEEVAE